MTTAGDLIQAALRRLGILAAGETYTTDEGADALAVLNGLLNEWRAHRLLVYVQGRHAYTLTANTAAYTIGDDATFDQPRPLWFDAVTYVDSDGNETELEILRTAQEWARLDKTLTSSLPTAVHVGTQMSWTTLTFHPIPTAAVNVAIYSPESNLVSVAATTTAISLPPGWWNALVFNLALELAPLFGKPIDGFLTKRAADTLATIKRVNVNMDVLEMPADLPGAQRGRYDINTDSYR